MRVIDLSVPVEPSPSEPVPVEIDFVSHADGADILGKPAGLDRTAFPNQMAVSLEHVRLTSHTGTHVDAPAHYGPICAGERARTIDELPLEWFVGPGVLLDLDTGSEDVVSVAEVEAELQRIGHQLSPGDIVLINTGADARWGSPSYFTDFRGVGRDATAYLVERGVKVIGIDSFGFDAPFHRMLRDYTEGGGPAALWPAHLYGREREYCQIERLTNLTGIGRSTGFTVVCLPVKLAGAGAGWCRAVAIVDEQDCP
ncbi:cyclase family protein [Kribbella sp. CA-253562]|uniref:cyclase family protein n=1 Tax=Kribbella sp. CA-253562 TaxID=3239942 RepID=UPI003D93AB61